MSERAERNQARLAELVAHLIHRRDEPLRTIVPCEQLDLLRVRIVRETRDRDADQAYRITFQSSRHSSRATRKMRRWSAVDSASARWRMRVTKR